MRKKLFFVLILMIFFAEAKAQKTATKNVKEENFKTAVLVLGNRNAAVAAAIQSAISGVNTTILLQAGGFDIVSPINDLSSGFQDKFLKKYKEGFFLMKDSVELGGSFDKLKANSILKLITDSIKNLKVIRNIVWVKADRSGNNWNFKLSDGSTLKPKVLINAGDEKLNEALRIEVKSTRNWTKLAYNTTIYRTSVAAGKSVNGTNANVFSLYDFFIPQQENLVWINDPQSMELGQAAGATAAYSAFYDTKTSLSNLKKIQGELINYKLNLMPFADIKIADTNWKAIQMVGVTGVLKGDNNGNFSPDKLVTTEEIKQPIKDFYYKAQIWFDDYRSPQITIGSALEMICYVGNKSPENTKKEIDKKWKTTYQFKTELDLNRQINRRELAVLLQDYMPPFNVNIDQNGKVVR